MLSKKIINVGLIQTLPISVAKHSLPDLIYDQMAGDFDKIFEYREIALGYIDTLDHCQRKVTFDYRTFAIVVL